MVGVFEDNEIPRQSILEISPEDLFIFFLAKSLAVIYDLGRTSRRFPYCFVWRSNIHPALRTSRRSFSLVQTAVLQTENGFSVQVLDSLLHLMPVGGAYHPLPFGGTNHPMRLKALGRNTISVQCPTDLLDLKLVDGHSIRGGCRVHRSQSGRYGHG